MSDVHLEYVNEVFVKVRAEPSTIMELQERFTYYAPGYKFSPLFRSKAWDGKIKLLNGLSGLIYAGLAKDIKKFCDSREYTFTFDDKLFYENVSRHELERFIETLNIPEKFKPREYQVDSILKCIRTKRRTLLSPTSSGKSLIIYILTQWYAEHKSLIMVPSIGLVTQMAGDFRDYGYQGELHLSTDGLSKSNNIDADIVITTWQSVNNGKQKQSKSWYEQFGMVLADEAHGVKATILKEILSNMPNCKYRFGTTGTLNDDSLEKSTIQGLLGPIYSAITQRELMDQKFTTPLLIKCIVLKYDQTVAKQFHKDLKAKKTSNPNTNSYSDEIDFLVNNEKRNKFIKNLTLSLTGNKLLFFRIIEHGRKLFELITSSTKDNVFYIDGSIKSDEREKIRHAIEDEQNATLVASSGTTSTGISIKKLHHMISGSPSKSKIKVLQSIGRMLRQHESKDIVYLYDIVDDLSYKSKTNFTLEHFKERLKIYDDESFDYKIYYVQI